MAKTPYIVFLKGFCVYRNGLPEDLFVPQLSALWWVESGQVCVGTHQCALHVSGSYMDLADEPKTTLLTQSLNHVTTLGNVVSSLRPC